MEYPHNIIYEYEKLHDAVYNALAKEIHKFNKGKTMFTQEQFKNLEDALCQYGGVSGDEMRDILHIAHAHTKKPKYRMKTLEELIAEGYKLEQDYITPCLVKNVSSINLIAVIHSQLDRKTFEHGPNNFFVEVTE